MALDLRNFVVHFVAHFVAHVIPLIFVALGSFVIFVAPALPIGAIARGIIGVYLREQFEKAWGASQILGPAQRFVTRRSYQFPTTSMEVIDESTAP